MNKQNTLLNSFLNFGKNIKHKTPMEILSRFIALLMLIMISPLLFIVCTFSFLFQGIQFSLNKKELDTILKVLIFINCAQW